MSTTYLRSITFHYFLPSYPAERVQLERTHGVLVEQSGVKLVCKVKCKGTV